MPERPDSQTPALALLRDVLGYSATTGAELTKERGTLSDPWLESRLLAAVKRVNPGLGEGAARQAILTLRPTAGSASRTPPQSPGNRRCDAACVSSISRRCRTTSSSSPKNSW